MSTAPTITLHDPIGYTTGQVADWAVYPGSTPGQGYVRDRITGALATIARAGAGKTVQLQDGSIVDVPANTLAVRARADGKGYEASIEPQSQNYLKYSYFSLDSNDDNLADGWTKTGAGTALRTVGDAPYGNTQGFRTVGAGQNTVIEQYTDGGSFSSGQSATLSLYYKMSGLGAPETCKAGVLAYNGSTYLGVVASTPFVNQTEWTRTYVAYSSLPAGTTRLRVYPLWGQAADADTDFTVYMACVQVEKNIPGNVPSSFIPTTTATVYRSADDFYVPDRMWSQTGGTVFMSVRTPTSYTPAAGLLYWYETSSNRVAMYWGNAGSSVNGYVTSAGVYYTAIGISGQALDSQEVYGMSWGTGQKANVWDGTVEGGDSATIPACPSINTYKKVFLCQYASASYMAGWVSRMVVYGSKLSDVDHQTVASQMAGTTTFSEVGPVVDYLAKSSGVMEDQVAGGTITAARAGVKTVEQDGHVVDVAVNKLAVRRRPDGKRGYEALFEEARTNYMLNSVLAGSGLPSPWSSGGSITGTPVYTLSPSSVRPSENALRMQYTGIVTDSAKYLQPSMYTNGSTFAAGETGIASCYNEAITCTTGAQAVVRLAAYNVGSYLGYVQANLGAAGTRPWVAYPSLPAGTTRLRMYFLFDGIDNGEVVDFTMSCPQIEKMAYGPGPTSYIPTTVAEVSRNHDVVAMDVTGWSMKAGTSLAVMGTQPVNVGNGRVFEWQYNSDNMWTTYVAGGTYGSAYANYRSGAVSYHGARGVAVPWTGHVLAGVWAGGIDTQAWTDTLGYGSTNGGPPPILTNLPATAYLGSRQGTVLYLNGGMQRFTHYPVALTAAELAAYTAWAADGPLGTVPIAASARRATFGRR